MEISVHFGGTVSDGYGSRVPTSQPNPYLDLVVEAVNGSLYERPYYVPIPKRKRGVGRIVQGLLDRRGIVLARRTSVSTAALEQGDGWEPSRVYPAHSMIGRARLTNVRELVETVVDEGVAGDLIETGVWRGGATIVMQAVLASRGVTDRCVYVADSFEGLPTTDKTDDAGDLHLDNTLAVSQEEVAENFRRYGLLNDRVRFVKGWFCESLPALRDQTWALIRLDGDLYDSTMDAITNLYPNLSPGGFVVVDDYGTYESCRRAIDEYRAANSITDEMTAIDRNGVYWRRSA